jgi:hypothetical protein
MTFPREIKLVLRLDGFYRLVPPFDHVKMLQIDLKMTVFFITAAAFRNDCDCDIKDLSPF